MIESKTNEIEQSEFNAAIATLMRLDIIKKNLIVDTLNENYLNHYKDLISYYKELESIFNSNDKEIQANKFIRHMINYREIKPIYDRGKDKNFRMPIRLIDWLNEWELELRGLEQTYGLNMPKKGGMDETPENWDD